ncbi:MAG: YdcF family protein [Fervidobacterium sp.]|nr:YdcF family protein [Fervidobacterium sp.]
MLHLFKIVSAFITIPGIFVTAFSIIFIFYSKTDKSVRYTMQKNIRKDRYLFLVFAIIMYLISSSWFTYLISKSLVLVDTEDNGKYIVVLGGGVDKFDQRYEIGKHTLRRLYKALELYKKNPRKIIVTGGVVDKGLPEALFMKKVLINFGIPEEDVIIENKARNTFENGKYTRELIGDTAITLVTSSLHMKRSLWVFKKFFSKIYYSSADVPIDFRNSYLDYLPSFEAFSTTCYFFREVIGILQYWLVYGG